MRPVVTTMNAQLFAPEGRQPLAVIEDLIADHGVWRTLGAFLAALVRRDRTIARRVAGELNDHLRRDIGLEHLPEPRKYWELRL